jgi:hypothetical protein
MAFQSRFETAFDPSIRNLFGQLSPSKTAAKQLMWRVKQALAPVDGASASKKIWKSIATGFLNALGITRLPRSWVLAAMAKALKNVRDVYTPLTLYRF